MSHLQKADAFRSSPNIRKGPIAKIPAKNRRDTSPVDGVIFDGPSILVVVVVGRITWSAPHGDTKTAERRRKTLIVQNHKGGKVVTATSWHRYWIGCHEERKAVNTKRYPDSRFKSVWHPVDTKLLLLHVEMYLHVATWNIGIQNLRLITHHASS